MKRSTLIGIVLAVLAGALVLLLWPSEELTPEQIIERQVIQMADAAEKKDVAAVMEHVSERFQGGQSMSKDDLKRLIAAQVFRGTWVRVFVRDIDVQLASPTEAEFTGKFIFGRSQADTVEKLAAQSQIQGYLVTGKLEKEADGEWRFVSGSYRAMAPGEIF